MAKTSFHEAYGVSEDMVTELGDQIFELSHNKQSRRGDPVRELPGEFAAAELPQGVRDVEVFCRGCLVMGGPSSSIGLTTSGPGVPTVSS